jgi:SAM-dependent methyltransferase
MNPDQRLVSERFPRSSQYHPEWAMENAFGSNPLWLAEWLAGAMVLKPGMRVLDLGCGRAKSSVFLAREFGVQVWATDLWISASENLQRIRDAGLEDCVFAIHADARSLPFAAEFFDAIISLDSYSYYGSDGLYLNYLVHFLKPGGQIGIAGAGLVKEFEAAVPEHLKRFWTQDCWGLHSALWWRQHWERTGIMDIEVADTMPDGWRVWLDWYNAALPDGGTQIETLQSDQGQYLGYVRLVGRRREDIELEDYCWPDTLRSSPVRYERKPLLRANAQQHGDERQNCCEPDTQTRG